MKTPLHIFQRINPLLLLAGILLITTTTSCFTGVEGTKKITLSKDDRKAILPSAEDEFFGTVKGIPLSDWQIGRPFIAADNKTLLIFEQQGLPLDPDEVKLEGKTLLYAGTEPRLAPDGSSTMVIIFTEGGNTYRFNTGKNIKTASSEVMSDQIPMMIDESMVDYARELLYGKQLWTRSPLWYDEEGKRIPGHKYVPVTITSVAPGTLVFPIKLSFTDEDGEKAWVFMNFGNSSSESRAFANVFYLSDFRKNYPSVTDEVWQLICRGDIANGMTKTECKLSLGNPSEVDAGHDYSQTLDLWHYPDGTVLWFEDGVLTRFRR